MKVLVTGACGFIGSYVISNLIDRKIDVVATDMDSGTAKERVWYSKVTFVEYVIDDDFTKDNLFEKFHRPEKVMHFAWKGLPNYKELFHLEENLPKQFEFLKNLIVHGLKDLLVAGTCFEYGMQSGKLSETMPSAPDNPYALAKDRLRQKLEELRQENNFILKWPRLFYLYGKGQNPKALLPQLDQAIERGDSVFNMSKGDQKRDYLPVETMADYLVRIAMQDDVTGIINCCSGKPITILSLVENHLKQSGKKIKLNPGYYPYPDYEPIEFWGDTQKLQAALNSSS